MAEIIKQWLLEQEGDRDGWWDVRKLIHCPLVDQRLLHQIVQVLMMNGVLMLNPKAGMTLHDVPSRMGFHQMF